MFDKKYLEKKFAQLKNQLIESENHAKQASDAVLRLQGALALVQEQFHMLEV